MTTTRTYSVPTISCDHCVSAITDAVSPLPGVQALEVEVASKTVRVDGGDDNEIRAAIDDAGYDIDD